MTASTCGGSPVISSVIVWSPESTMCARVSSTTRSNWARSCPATATLTSARSRATAGTIAQILDLQHVDQLVDTRVTRWASTWSLSSTIVMRETPGLGRAADGERLDVEGAPAEHQRDPVEHARLVLDQRDER